MRGGVGAEAAWGRVRRPRSGVGDFKNGVIKVGFNCIARGAVRVLLNWLSLCVFGS